MSNIEDKFWLDDLNNLFNNYLEFFPTKYMTRTQQLNSLSRYSIYLFIIFLVFSNNKKWLYIPILLILICIMLNYIEKKDKTEENMKRIEDRKNMIREYKDIAKTKKCKKPTITNPYMNVLISDYHNNSNRDPACDVNETDIKEARDKYYNENLYKNVDDLYDKKNSQRQFYTMPVTTIPNDQKTFADWCYKSPDNCKYNGINCLTYEDIRYHK